MTSVAEYQKVIVVTDPENPDEDLMKQVASMGEIAAKIPCSDGLVLLVRSNEETFKKICDEISTPQA